MDLLALLKELPALGVHGLLALAVYVLWRKTSAVERALIDCLQSGGKVEKGRVDDVNGA